MEKYFCPMHPEVKSDKPGHCPKCGMELVTKETEKQSVKTSWKNYMPLLVIFGLLLLSTTLIETKLGFSTRSFITFFMAGFFLVFSSFKIIDLKGFAQGYSTYDLLAKRWFAYGYIYPFIELFFGLAMILNFASTFILWAEIVVMSFSGLGVALKLLKGEKFQCVCLGTFLKVPLTTVTLIEDFGMAILAAVLLTMK